MPREGNGFGTGGLLLYGLVAILILKSREAPAVPLGLPGIMPGRTFWVDDNGQVFSSMTGPPTSDSVPPAEGTVRPATQGEIQNSLDQGTLVTIS